MGTRYRSPSVEEDSDDDLVEIDRVDLTDEQAGGAGPVDIKKPTQASIFSNRRRTQVVPRTSTVEVHVHVLSDGTHIREGEFVELRAPQHRQTHAMNSGDFIRIRNILKDRDTGEITLRGHRFGREQYLIGTSWKGDHPRPDVKISGPLNKRLGPRMNELILHLTVEEEDNRPEEVQSLEVVQLDQIKCKRAVILTDKPYPMLGYLDPSFHQYAILANMTEEEWKANIFEMGPLVCRSSWTSIISPNGNEYGGVWKYFSRKDIVPQQQPQHSSRIGHRPLKPTPLSKNPPYTVFDMFSGAGAASQGAREAGFKVLGGLDHDQKAMEAFELNHPGAMALCIDSFEFLRYKEILRVFKRVVVLIICFPCQPYSPNHTTKGKNDEINIAQLHILKDIIEALKPSVVVLENTSGLVNMKKNRRYFNKVLNDVSSAGAGYNLQHKVVNMMDYGLPQKRKRLVIIAAKKDLPLPPFPKPTHGPAGSGLKPYVTIGEALAPLERHGGCGRQDDYHRPHRRVPREDWLYDPYTEQLNCITTRGVSLKHWSGEPLTPRELALLQSLEHNFRLTGSWSQAIMQIGNMFPPIMVAAILKTIAQTLEAFHLGLIDADENIDDINVTLIEKGVTIPESGCNGTSLFALTDEPTTSAYRYLQPTALTDVFHAGHSSPWAPRRLHGRNMPVAEDEDEVVGSPPADRRANRAAMTSEREKEFWNGYDGTVIDFTGD